MRLELALPSSGQDRNRHLIGDEENCLLKACDEHNNHFLGWIVRIALYTSMRKSEITLLTREQIKLRKRTIFLPDTKNGSIRTVPLTSKAYLALKEVLNHPIHPIDTNLIFSGEPGGAGQRKSYVIYRVCVQALERAEINGFRFHYLRHEATSRFVEANLPDQQVSSITGHKSMQMLKRYTHLKNKKLVKLLNDM